MAARTALARSACRFTPRPCLSRTSTCRGPTSFLQMERSRLTTIIQTGGFRRFSAAASLREKKYTEDHEWIELAADGKTSTVGITHYAANALGDVIFVELPEIGLEVGRGDSIGAVESVKSASDILSPSAGKVAEINSALEETPAQINKDPEGDGWIAKLEISQAAKDELGELMSAEAYNKFTKESES